MRIGLLTACMALAACSQQPQATPTPTKPAPDLNSIVGVELGAQKATAECSVDKYSGPVVRRYQSPPPYAPCWMAASGPGLFDDSAAEFPPDSEHDGEVPAQFGQQNVPSSVDQQGWMTFIDGIAEGVRLKITDTKMQTYVYRLLVDKYGQPTQTNFESPTRVSGLDSSIHATWAMPRMKVVMIGESGRGNVGYIFATTPKVATWELAKKGGAPSKSF